MTPNNIDRYIRPGFVYEYRDSDGVKKYEDVELTDCPSEFDSFNNDNILSYKGSAKANKF